MAACVSVWSPFTGALTPQQLQHETQLTELATARCNTEQIEGSDYSIKTRADGNVEVQFFGKKGGEIEGTFVYSKKEWEGRQKVLQEHQANENVNRRECIKEELKSLRDSYTPPKATEHVEPVVGQSIRIIDRNTEFTAHLGEVVHLTREHRVTFSTRRSSYGQPAVGIVEGKAKGLSLGVPREIEGIDCSITLVSFDKKELIYQFYFKCEAG